MKTDQRRSIPSVDKVLRALGELPLPRPVVAELVRRQIHMVRQSPDLIGESEIVACVRSEAEALLRRRVTPVINGTGVIVHTNLGRAPLSEDAIRDVAAIAGGYSTLEFDLASGERGGRGLYLEHLLAVLCNSEAATIVNNCAAALVLIVRGFCRRGQRRVIISRGELVQIGGGFRIPEILEASGARLVEVGTTNKTLLSDYADAIDERVALILRVHRSNFVMDGFVESPARSQLVALARQRRVALVEDLGSGAVTNGWGNARYHEPTITEALAQGVDLVCFSGDKLLGGPQAGIIAGATAHVAMLKKHPLFRALRCDKMTFAAMQTTVEEHLRGGANVGICQLLALREDDLKKRAGTITAQLADLPLSASVVAAAGKIGGGALPQHQIPSVAMAIVPAQLTVEEFSHRLRCAETPVIGYIAEGRFHIDLRTVFEHQDELLLRALRAATAAKEPRT